MKRTLLLLTLLFTGATSFAQFDLEHTYDQGAAVRIKLAFAGEKYYIHDRANNRVDLYNADHTFWKSIDTPVPSQGFFVGISNVSDATINNDENVEVIYAFYQSGFIGGTFYSNVISEDGSVLLSVANCNYLYVDETPGLQPKLISYGVEKKIFGLPGLDLEHTYSSTGIVSRIVLENSGEKYYLLDDMTGQAKLFNADHSLWKSVSLPKPLNDTYTNISFVSETAINADAQLEIGYSYYTNSGGFMYTDKIVNENGTDILTQVDGYGLQLSKINGLETKLIAYGTTTKIYQLPSLAVEHTYAGSANRTVLDVSGEKYYVTNDQYQLLIYNSDHTLWKTIALSVPGQGYRINDVSGISEHKFNQDDQVEVVYTALNDVQLEVYFYESRVVKENGQVLLSVPDASYLYLSEINGLDNKLIAHLSGDEQTEANIGGKVYGIDNTMAVAGFEHASEAIAYPNPAASNITLQSNTAIVAVSIFDTRGVLIETSNGNDIKNVNVESLSAGIYLLHLTDGNGAITTSKIVVAH